MVQDDLPGNDSLAPGEKWGLHGTTESAALIGQARAGSNSALGRLLEDCRDYLLLVANEEVSDDLRQKMAASDLVQETLAEACEGFEKFRGESHEELLAWLKRILLHNVTDAAREYRGTAKRDVARERSLHDSESKDRLGIDLVADQSTPSGRAIAAEEHQKLLLTLEKLPAHYREVIQRRNLEYQSFVEVGQQMELSADSARKLWDRAIECLAKELSVHDGEQSRG